MTGKINVILRERKGIALASVMIIFIVAVILVTGITTAITAQANIIKSRANVTQAHYYAYSAVQSVLTALTDEKANFKMQPDGTYAVSVNNLTPSGWTMTTKVYPQASSDASIKKFRLVAEVTHKTEKAISEVNFQMKDKPKTNPGSEIFREFKAPLAFIEGENIPSHGINITEEGKTENFKTYDSMLEYKWQHGNKTPEFTLKYDINSLPYYTALSPMTGNKVTLPVKPPEKSLIIIPDATEVILPKDAELNDVFIYAPKAKKVSDEQKINLFDKVILYAPLAEFLLNDNKYNTTSGFIYVKKMTIDKLSNASDLHFNGMIVSSDSFNMEGNNNKSLKIEGALITNKLNLNYSVNKIDITPNFILMDEDELINTYLHDLFNFTLGGTSIIVDDSSGGGSSGAFYFDPTSIVYKK